MMKKQIKLGCFAALSLCGQASFSDVPSPGPLFDLTKIDASTFIVHTTNPHRGCYNSAGIKTLSPYANLMVASDECIPHPLNGYCLFTACNAASSHIPVIFGYSGPAGELDLKLCLNGKGTRGAGCESKFHGITMQYAYVADNGNNAGPTAGGIWQCGVHPNGKLGTTNDGQGTCLLLNPARTPPSYHPWGAPWKISFTDVKGAEYAYIADGTPNAALATNNVYTCLVNPNGETFEYCSVSTETGVTFTQPRQVAFATIAGTQYAYVADPGNAPTDAHTVYQCKIADDGHLSDCISQLALEWDDGPVGVTVDKTGDRTYVYVPDSGPIGGPGYVRQCPLDSLGQIEALVNCHDMIPNDPAVTANGFNPVEVAIRNIDDKKYAYIADAANGVWTCPVSSTTGRISDVCTGLSTTGTSLGIAVAPVYNSDKNKVYHAYVSTTVASPSTNPGVMRCDLSPTDGSLVGTTCVDTAAGQQTITHPWEPSGTTILSYAHETAPHG